MPLNNSPEEKKSKYQVLLSPQTSLFGIFENFINSTIFSNFAQSKKIYLLYLLFISVNLKKTTFLFSSTENFPKLMSWWTTLVYNVHARSWIILLRHPIKLVFLPHVLFILGHSSKALEDEASFLRPSVYNANDFDRIYLHAREILQSE